MYTIQALVVFCGRHNCGSYHRSHRHNIYLHCPRHRRNRPHHHYRGSLHHRNSYSCHHHLDSNHIRQQDHQGVSQQAVWQEEQARVAVPSVLRHSNCLLPPALFSWMM